MKAVDLFAILLMLISLEPDKSGSRDINIKRIAIPGNTNNNIHSENNDVTIFPCSECCQGNTVNCGKILFVKATLSVAGPLHSKQRFFVFTLQVEQKWLLNYVSSNYDDLLQVLI